jgi:hypothetical protein
MEGGRGFLESERRRVVAQRKRQGALWPCGLVGNYSLLYPASSLFEFPQSKYFLMNKSIVRVKMINGFVATSVLP